MTSSHLIRVPILLSLAIACVTPAVAEPFVSWGLAEYTTGYMDLNIDAPETGENFIVYGFSDTVPKSPMAENGYAGPKFYGAFSLENTDGGMADFKINEFGVAPALSAAGNNWLKLISETDPSQNAITMRGMLFFKKEDFAPAAKSVVTLDENSSFFLSAKTEGSMRQIQFVVRALYLGEWGWYVSYYGNSGSKMGFQGAGKWTPLLLGENTQPLPDSPESRTNIYTIDGENFEDIDAVGIFFKFAADKESSSGKVMLYLNTFEVNATLNPASGN